MRVAVFGGSFNPPHIGHQMVCLAALETAPIDLVLMIPAYRHAFDKELAPFEHRFAMCQLAAAIFGQRVEVSRVEAELAGEDGEVSRTLHTLQRLQATNPDHKYRLLVGTDILAETHKWYRWSEVARLAPPLVLQRGDRPGSDSDLIVPDVSSTDVRDRLGRGDDVRGLVSVAVIDYIAGAGLYRPDP